MNKDKQAPFSRFSKPTIRIALIQEVGTYEYDSFSFHHFRIPKILFFNFTYSHSNTHAS